jgi:hypothetical protein
MNNIVLYANIYINNNLGIKPIYYEYVNYICNVQEKALSCIPYNKIVINDTFIKHITGSLYITNKIFQFKCELYDISPVEIKKIIDLLYKKDFFYVNYYTLPTLQGTLLIDESSVRQGTILNELELSLSKEEHIINKLMLLSKNEPKNIIEMSI